MMAMALNPEKQKRAQAEVDNIVGSDRMPAISDIAQMPYVNLVIKETLRSLSLSLSLSPISRVLKCSCLTLRQVAPIFTPRYIFYPMHTFILANSVF